MRAWQYSSASAGLEKSIHLNEDAVDISRPLKENEILVEVISMGLNPADYKIAEMGILARALVKVPASPGMDFSGRVVSIGSGIDSLKVGGKVFGRLEPTQYGSLGQYIITNSNGCVSLPEGVDADQGAAVGTAGLTAYQSIAPNVKAGDKVFINGGAGGTGTFGIQIAKALGCHVTVSCSSAKVALCKELGADEVIDYTTTNVSQKLEEAGQVFSVVVDNVGTSPADLYTKANNFLLPSGKFVHIGGAASLESLKTIASRMLWPRFLGGGSRKLELYATKNSHDDLQQLAELMKEGKVKAVIDKVFEMEQVPEAIERLKIGKSTGKIIVHVTKDAA